MDLMSLMIRIGADVASAVKGIDEVKGGMEGAEKEGNTFSDKMKSIGTVLKTAFTAVAIKKVADGLSNLVTNAASTADHIDKMSQKIGISREAYQELDFVMSQSGTSVDNLQAGMKTLTAAMDNVKSGNKDTTATFEKLGVAVTNSDGTFRSQEEVFFDTVTALQNVDDQTEKARLATELFGRSGLELMPLLNGAAGSMDEMRQQAHDLGLVMEDDAIDAGVHLTDSIDQVKRAFAAVVTQLGVDLMPLVQTVLDWVIQHMPEIREFVSGAFDVIQSVIGTVVGVIRDWLLPAFSKIWKYVVETVVPKVQTAWNTFRDAANTVFTAIKGYWDDTLKPALEALWTLVVETVVPKVREAWNNMKNTISVVFNAVKGFWITTLKPAFDEIWTFVVETVVPKVREAWNNMKNTVSVVFNAIKGFWTTTLKPALEALWTFVVETVVPKVREAWNNLKNTVSIVFNAVKSFWVTTLKPALEALWTFVVETVVPKVRDAWNNMKNTVSIVFNAIKGFWTTTLKPAVDALWKFIVETVVPKAEEAWDSLKGTVSTVFDAIKGFWENTLKPAFEAIKTFLEETLKPIFENTFNAIKDTVDIALRAIDDLWNNTVKPIYDGIVQFFSGIFKGDMEQAWNGIKELIDGVWNGITTAAEAVWEAAKKWGTTLWSNFKTFFDNGWNLIKDEVLGVWDNITNKAEEIWESAKDWGISIFNNFKESIKTGWENIKQWFENLWDEIKAIPQKLIDAALNWGADMINNFKAGIEQKWEDLKQGISDIGTGIANLLGFSVPKEGPLSDADTWMPDMIDLLVKGVNDSAHLITTTMGNLVNNIKVAFKLAGSGAYTEFNTGLNGIWGNQLENAIKTPFNNAIYAVQHMNWRSLGWNVKDDFLSGLNGLYDSVRNAFDFSSIYVKTPHFQVKKWNEISGSYFPEMQVKWYRRAYDNPVMFTEPTVLPTAGGAKGFGDGVGGEVVLSASKLRELVGSGGSVTNNNTFNIYQREGEDMEQLARRIEDILTRQQNQRKAAFA